MKQFVTTLERWCQQALASRAFWWATLAYFGLSTVWFILSANYPMAFDENYHFGLIQLHAHHWVPFFTSQPAHSGIFGPMARDPSYLYHWIFSLPYRVLATATASQAVQIIVLRILNAALFICSLFLYRKVLREIGATSAMTNFVLALFMLIPVVPFLAATINYDNLFFVMLAATVLLTFRVLREQSFKHIEAAQLIGLLILLLLGSIVKYSFLPVAAATGLFVLWRAWRSGLLSMHGWRAFSKSFMRLSFLLRVILVLVCLLAMFLFTERYGKNLVVYRNPVPACNDVISQDECLSYGPYDRDELFKSSKPPTFHAHPLGYLWQWLYGMWYRLHFAVNSDYATAPPLLIISRISALVSLFCAIGIVLRFRTLFANHSSRQHLLIITICYSLVLFATGFQAYAETGQPVAINGRYLLPFLPFLLAFGVFAWSQLLARTNFRLILAAGLIVVMLLQGGGAVTFLIRSHDEWFWDNAPGRSVNRAARSALWYTIPYKDTLRSLY